MDESEVFYEDLQSRTSFILDISLKNLLDYNGFLQRYQDCPYYFEVCLGVIDFDEFYQIGQIFRKEIQPMIITQWDQTQRFELQDIDFDTEIAIKLRVYDDYDE